MANPSGGFPLDQAVGAHDALRTLAPAMIDHQQVISHSVKNVTIALRRAGRLVRSRAHFLVKNPVSKCLHGVDFGLAVGSVVCFLAVVMAWYGVNFVLGTGLHSYGFGIGGESYVMTAVVLDLLYVSASVFRYLRRGEEALSPKLVSPAAVGSI